MEVLKPPIWLSYQNGDGGFKHIHGEEGGLNQTDASSIKKGTWGRIITCRDWASKHGLCISSLFRYKLGNGKKSGSGKTYGVGQNHCK